MSTSIMQGTTCTLRFRPSTDVDLSTLGDPEIAISQSLVYVQPDDVTIDTDENCVVAKLTEEDTMSLTAGETAQVQVIFTTDTETFRSNVGELSVDATIAGLTTGDDYVETIDDQDEDEEEAE